MVEGVGVGGGLKTDAIFLVLTPLSSVDVGDSRDKNSRDTGGDTFPRLHLQLTDSRDASWLLSVVAQLPLLARVGKSNHTTPEDGQINIALVLSYLGGDDENKKSWLGLTLDPDLVPLPSQHK